MKLTLKRKLMESTTKFLQSKEEIQEWLDKYDVQNYEINDDLTVTVNGHLDLSYKSLREIPVKFNAAKSIDVTGNTLKSLDWSPETVEGDFDCWDNEIETLVGGPVKVTGSFDCDTNKLRDLQGAPREVGKSFICTKNTELRSLAGCPDKVGSYFKAANCNIESLDHFPSSVGTNVYLQCNNIKSLKGLNKLLKNFGFRDDEGKKGFLNFLQNPIESGLLTVLGIKGVTGVSLGGGANNDDLNKVEKIINNAIDDKKDAFDTQDELIDNNLGKYS